MSEPVDPYELRARLHRIMAGRLRIAAAQHDLFATMATTAKAMKTFTDAFNAGIAQDVANHPVVLEAYLGR